MPDPAERFLAAATAPLGDNAELQVMARRELEECLVDGDAEDLAVATETLERKKPRRGWKIALYAVTAAVSVVSLGLLGRMATTIEGVRMILSPLAARQRLPSPVKKEAHLGKNLNAEQRLLLFGDTSNSNPAERFKTLWDSDPGNPAYFAEYSIHYINESDRLPPDYLETAANLDPDNAWFTLMAAGVAAEGSVKQNASGSIHIKQGIPPGFKILDQVRLNEAVELLEKAASQPRFDSYQTGLTMRRIALLPQQTDLGHQLPYRVHLAGFPVAVIQLTHAASAANAAAWQAADRGDAEEFQRVAAIWEPCLRRWAASECPDLYHSIALRSVLTNTSYRFANTNFPELKALNDRWQPISAWLSEDRQLRDSREWDEELKLKGGMLVSLSLPMMTKQLQTPIPITGADLKPGRMVDHELFSRISAAVVWLVFGLTLLAAAIYRQRASVLVRRLSGRLEDLLKSADWVWILGAGVVLPFVFYLAIYRLTLLGARDWSIAASAFMVPSGQVAAMGFLMIVLPLLIARWRLGRRGAILGWRKGRAWMGWTAVICGALSLPVFGLSFARGKGSEAVIMIAAALLGILVLAWLIIGIRAVFSKRTALLRRVTLSRVLVPAYALGMLLMAASMPLYHAAEKRWLAQDRLMEITPEAPAMSRYEWEVAQAMRAELLEILNTK
jgi:hypothetical protein